MNDMTVFQTGLSIIKPGDIYQHPTAAKPSMEHAENIAAIAARMRRWPEMHEAVDRLIDYAREIVHWWDDHVRIKGGAGGYSDLPAPGKSPRRLSRGDAESIIGIRTQQIRRFREALRDTEIWHDRIIERTCRNAGIEPYSADPHSHRPTPSRSGPDFWATPDTLVRACVQHVLPVFPPDMAIWEPACGDGRLAEAFRDAGCEVYATDLYPQDDGEEIDFLDCIPPEELTCVITNPPYNQSDEFLERCMTLFDDRRIEGFALLLRHDHLQAGGRVAAFNRAILEVHCNWRPLWIEGSDGQPRWSFHWLCWFAGERRPPIYLSEVA